MLSYLSNTFNAPTVSLIRHYSIHLVCMKHQVTMETEEPTWQTWSYLELRTLRRMGHTSTQRGGFSKLGNTGNFICLRDSTLC